MNKVPLRWNSSNHAQDTLFPSIINMAVQKFREIWSKQTGVIVRYV